ncbi:hypothetical protein EA187_04650 [Lujinxingia sediminis]|uniref:Uncharacterized protein n=1 Tax=Lujinxingia sediminis TaxID=2480984 RepID=A0ABY0CYM5_9DELT|nr:hypothetical protein [Lujinxingia sediminis]RVU48724.1 hypothetical protein EA187_04650 [Lujinxingia sediminis]
MTQSEFSNEALAHALGLGLRHEGDTRVVERRGLSVRVDAAALPAPESAPERATAAWALYGIRLGLDVEHARRDAPKKEPRFRRTSVQRYHEAPTFYGEHLLHLVPRWTRRWFESVGQEVALWRPTLDSGGHLEEVIVHETGLRIDVMTRARLDESDTDEATRWENARTALFYNSYKVRGTTSKDVEGVRLRTLSTTEGFGASRALVMPELDFDSAQDRGFIATPTRDHVLIVRPDPPGEDERQKAKALLSKNLNEHFNSHPFPLTDARWQLERDTVLLDPGDWSWPGQHLADPAELLLER